MDGCIQPSEAIVFREIGRRESHGLKCRRYHKIPTDLRTGMAFQSNLMEEFGALPYDRYDPLLQLTEISDIGPGLKPKRFQFDLEATERGIRSSTLV